MSLRQFLRARGVGRYTPSATVNLPVQRTFLLRHHRRNRSTLPTLILSNKHATSKPKLCELEPLDHLKRKDRGHNLPYNNGLRNLQTTLRNTTLNPNRMITRPTRSNHSIRLLNNTNTPVTPVNKATRRPLRHSRHALPNNEKNSHSAAVNDVNRGIRGTHRPTTIRNIIPSGNERVHLNRRAINNNKRTPHRLTQNIITTLPPLTSRLRIRLLASRHKVRRPNLTTSQLLPRLRVDIYTSRILSLSTRRGTMHELLTKRNGVRLFGVAYNVRDNSPSYKHKIVYEYTTLH